MDRRDDDVVVDTRFHRLRRTGDRVLCDELVEEHLGLARALATRYVGRGVPRDDLDQVAAAGLVKAVQGFDPARGTAFSSYAVPMILGELRHHFRDHAWTVRVPRRLQELRQQVDAAVEVLSHRLGREPTIADVARELGEDRDTVLLALDGLRSCYAPDPLEAPSTDAPTSSDPYADVELSVDVSMLLASLSSRERRVVALRYGRGHTQQEIADMVGCSQMHVSRLLRGALDELRVAATN